MKKGLSLIETLICLAILSVTFLLFTNVIMSMSRSYISLRTVRNLDLAAINTMDIMTREIRNASSVDASSILNTNPGTLVLNDVDSSGNITQKTFTIVSQQVHIKSGVVDNGSLDPTPITVPNLIFRSFSGGVSSAVKIEMTLEDKEGNATRDQKYYSTIILRGSYKND